MPLLHDLFPAVALGAVQGLTEFLPVSSSAHLILGHAVLGFNVDALSFDVSLHLGTLAAVVAVFWRDLWRYLRAFLRSLRRPDRTDVDQRMAWYLLLGSVPAGVVGFLLEGAAESTFRNPLLLAVTLSVGGILFIAVERFAKQRRTFDGLRLRDAVVVGVAQSLAIVPGFSRSGMTIATGMALGFFRPDATRFAFLLSVPIIAGAGAARLVVFFKSHPAGAEFALFGIGAIVSGVFGFLAIKILLRFVRGHTLIPFAVYRFLLAAAIVAVLVLR